MYHIRTTPGFVIDSKPRGEAGKVLSLFTRDFGLVIATAVGIRFEKSKLRYYTQDYSFGSFSLVKGKEFWRLTSAENTEEVLGERFKAQGESLMGREVNLTSQGPQELIARIALVLKRLLHGEETHPELFDVVSSCMTFLKEGEINHSATDKESLSALESLVMLRILNSLGYVGNDPEIKAYVNDHSISSDLLKKAAADRSLINKHINKALRESHL